MTKKQETQTTAPEPEEKGLTAAPAFDRNKASPIDPARRHNPTARTVAWEQDGYYYSCTGDAIARAEESDLEPGRKHGAEARFSGAKPAAGEQPIISNQ